MRLRKIDLKTIKISILFVIIYIYANFISIQVMIDKSIPFTANVYYNQIVNSLENNIRMLEKSVEKISSNDQIIKILEENKNYENLNSEEIKIVNSQIDTLESILSNMSFVKTINIVSLDGKYLFSKGNLYKDFGLTDRVWFKNEYLENKVDTITTSIHTDYTSKESTIAIVSFIYSKDGSEVLGAAVLDIFVVDMLKYINDSFVYGDLNSYILSNNGYTYSSDGEIRNSDIEKIHKNAKKYYVISDEQKFKGQGYIQFFFDKESIKYNEFNSYIKEKINFIIIIFGLIIGIFLIISIKIAYKPILKVMDKLKDLLDEVSDKNTIIDINNKNEIKQLEIISDSLEKSFDKKIKNLIYYDELTKLPNRKKLKLICEDMISNNETFALIFLDLNKFKYVNDVYGHSAGDDLLVTFSSIVESSIGNKGVVSRYSGDEFIIIYKNYIDEKEIREFYNNNIKPKFKDPILINDKLKVNIGFSLGVAIYPKHGKTYSDLIKKSDFMMYKNKQAGTNDIFMFSDDIYKEYLYIDTLKNELKNAVNNNEFVLHYQPIVNNFKEIKKAEALIRWNSKRLGFVSPDKFINYAEETRDIINIGYWIIETVCKDLIKLQDQGISIQISINVSPIQLMEEGFAVNSMEIIKYYGIDCKNLCFEIIESVVLDNNKIVNSNLLKLREFGIKIALDDFGTGYSSFNYLKKYKLDILKLDKIFIQDSYENDFKIVENIKNIVETLGMDIIVEGVETKEQFEKLSSIGCDLFQGYYFSKPILFRTLNELIDINKN